ncbi:MAG: ATP-binding protein [Thermodesulfobacteriota bacterium]
MRWGVLVNLAVILAVSGCLLFVVFCASLERAVIEERMQRGSFLAQRVENLVYGASSPEKLWQEIRNLCRSDPDLRLFVYDDHGALLGGCGEKADAPKPDPLDFKRVVTVEGARFPVNLFREMAVVADFTADFPHGVRSVRVISVIGPRVFSVAWQFFGAYLILTQAALFLLGYILFHRTIIGPLQDAAALATRAAGMAEGQDPIHEERKGGDIRRISASIKGMILKIMRDREDMQALVERLRRINRDLEAAQRGLVRSEKLASVGRLAAGLCHEIGNPLQILSGYVELLQKRPDRDSNAEMLGKMEQEVQRIHDILRNLLTFAQPVKEEMRSCDLNALVTEAGSFLEVRKGFREILFRTELDPKLKPILTAPEKLRQVLVNLIFNAADAMPDTGGEIVLRTRMTDEHAEIEIQDTGHGISEENLTKVLDPFFTTKEPGKGTGLGLPVCLSLVESLGGTLEIDSKEGSGTIVKVRLPADENQGPQ